MNLSKKFFLNSIKKFPYGSIEIEWPNGEIQTIKATNEGPHAKLKIVDENVVKEIIQGCRNLCLACYNLISETPQ